jgi:hypothetical protein
MTMTSSPVDAIAPAIDHVRRVLFRPFHLGRWFILGFLMFLQILGGGGSARLNFPMNWDDSRQAFDPRDAVSWITENLAIVAVIGFFLVLIGLAVGVLFLWLSSRATFCYVDSIATNRPAVVRPWREHKDVADSYFFWRLVFTVIVCAIGLLLLIPLFLSIWTLLSNGEELNFWTVIGSTGVIVSIVPLLLVGGATLLIDTLLVDFVAPIQYLRRIPCSQAFRIVRALAGANLGMFILYFALRIVIALAATFGIVAFGCMTCCIGFCLVMIPVVGQTLLQPLFVFVRSLPLFFLRGFGPEFDVFAPGVLGGAIASAGVQDPKGPQGPQEPSGSMPPPSGGDDPTPSPSTPPTGWSPPEGSSPPPSSP